MVMAKPCPVAPTPEMDPPSPLKSWSSLPESFTPLLVVRDRLAQRGPERAPVVVMKQVNEFVNDHVLDQPHRRLDDAPIEPDDS